MQKIYQFNAVNVYEGVNMEIADDAGCPLGWTFAVPPSVPDGWYAYFRGPDWIIIDRYPGSYPPVPPNPSLTTSYNPSPTTVGQPTTLSWTTTNANYVTFQSRGLTQYPANGSFSVTYGAVGTYNDEITAVGPGGSTSHFISLTVN